MRVTLILSQEIIHSKNYEFASSDSKNQCTRTEKVFPPYLRLALKQWPFEGVQVKNNAKIVFSESVPIGIGSEWQPWFAGQPWLQPGCLMLQYYSSIASVFCFRMDQQLILHGIISRKLQLLLYITQLSNTLLYSILHPTIVNCTLYYNKLYLYSTSLYTCFSNRFPDKT